MSLEENERTELISYRLEEAKETIRDVQLLIDNDRLRAAVNRIYYGMFYSLLALGLAYQFETSKHQTEGLKVITNRTLSLIRMLFSKCLTK